MIRHEPAYEVGLGDAERVLKGRAEPVDMMCVSDSSRGHGVGQPLTRSMATTVSMAHSMATPHVSPSPWRAWPRPPQRATLLPEVGRDGTAG
jgi:hypothetical protein